MKKEDVAGMRKTLQILRILADMDIVEQVIVHGTIVWRAKGSPRRFNAIMKALRLR